MCINVRVGGKTAKPKQANNTKNNIHIHIHISIERKKKKEQKNNNKHT